MSDGPETEDPPDPVDPGEPTDPDGPIIVGTAASVSGTPGDDIFARAAELSANQTASILAGDGNDTIDLFDETAEGPDTVFEQSLGAIRIDGGAGADVIEVATSGGLVDGGDGDDTITSFAGDGSTVNGGAGDDFIGGEQANTDAISIDGGAGNDTIDATSMENASLQGGSGADDIRLAGLGSSGAGYVVVADGGAGEDTLSYDGRGNIYDDFQSQPHRGAGGDGADTFALRLSEGARVVFDDDPGAGGSVSLGAFDILDFETGVDRVEIDATPESGDFTLSTARLETSSPASGPAVTELILRYESADGSVADRDVVVSFGTASVLPGDITFVGDVTPSLLPAASEAV